MTVPVLNVRSDHPRLFANSTQKTAITSATNSTSQWKTDWDAKILVYCGTASSDPDATLAARSQLDTRLLSLALGGWIDGVSSYHSKLLSAAKYLAQNSSLWQGWPDRREQVIALATAYTFLRAGGASVTFSDADRKILGDALVVMSDYTPGTSMIDGHDAGNCAAMFLAGLVLHNESGTGFNYVSEADARISTALTFYYGANATAANKISGDRHFRRDGGSGIGPWYDTLRGAFVFRVLHAIKVGCTSATLDGDPYDPMMDEDWVPGCAEYYLRTYDKGDGDYETTDDTGHTYPDPFFDPFIRYVWAILIKYSRADLRKALRWTRDRRDLKSRTAPYGATNHHYALEVPIWDPADTANASLNPKAAGLSKWKLFKVPGEFFYSSRPDDPASSVNIHFIARSLYYPGHTHLNAGALRIYAYGDTVLGRSGVYHTTPSTNNANFGGKHHRGWYQQSVAESGIPMVPVAGLTHKQRDLNGSLVDWPVAEGGQPWKEFVDGGTRKYDVDNVDKLRGDGNGLAWRSAGTDAIGTGELSEIGSEPDVYVAVGVDYTLAYLKEYAAEFGTAAQRVTHCSTRLMVIEDLGIEPWVLRLDRVITDLPSRQKITQWQTHGLITLERRNAGTPQDTFRASWQGFRKTGKITAHMLAGTDNWQASIPGGGSPEDLSSVAPNSFSYGGVDYTPNIVPNERDKPDFGRYRLRFASLSGARTETLIASLFCPGRPNATPPSFEWIRETQWIGIRVAPSKEYRLHTSQLLASVNVNTAPPDVPRNVRAESGASLGDILVQWDPNTDGRTQSYQVEIREV